MLFMLDNYDSFTYNLVQLLETLGQPVTVRRNDQITVAAVLALNPELIVVSPGPCSPAEAGISVALIQAASGRIPLLGVCLGHQAIGAAFGGRIVKAKRLMHGKTSPILHDGTGLFAGLKSPFAAIRYHSLAIAEGSMPACLEVIARADDGEVMAIRHREHPTYGVQFHPESILTPSGKRILANFIALANR
ncbi:MAG: aminodeoxychorismate/anthranilate synthase component II [Lentisphaeria bacterium]|jgi:anthranilate synthase/aminodeoxychorismate synthase-like glutamine amidotransferase